MIGEDRERWEEELAELLAAGDQALAEGKTPDFPTTEELPRECEQELKKELAYLRTVREVLGRARPAHTSGTAGELPWTELDRFQLCRELGRGGFGVVYLAHDPKLRRQVALKVPRPEVLLTPALRERFHREARAAAGLQHPNLVPLYEVGEAGPLCFLVSAYCPGPTLADWLRQHPQPVPYRDAASLVALLADAADHAHRHGIVHRDLKPANVLLQIADCRLQIERPDETLPGKSAILNLQSAIPKIADFGLAKQIGGGAEDDKTLTRGGAGWPRT
jgi:eukaryotic-like serine/threonine-protein kinase